VAAPPNFVGASARHHHGNVRVDLAAAPVGWGHGFVYSLSPAVARELAAQLIVAADAAEKTIIAEKSTAAASGD
jgi:hypothetical protein